MARSISKKASVTGSTASPATTVSPATNVSPATTVSPNTDTRAAVISAPSAPRQNRIASYGVTMLLSAFLLFQVQLVMGKFVLPRFGGGASVWSTSLLVFQFLLL